MPRKFREKPKLVFGVGVNDVDYIVQKWSIAPTGQNNKRKLLWVCPYYRKWRGILERGYSDKFHAKYPTYLDCTIDLDWLYLSNFIKWVDSQPNKDWESCDLDKDILFVGNKNYGKGTCVFISRSLNGFVIDGKGSRGKYLIGASWNKPTRKFIAHCNDPFEHKNIYLGLFEDELTAHKAWQAKKHEYACQLAELQEDSRVADALRQRYAPDKDWTQR